jgi:hypothetical protein
MASYIRKEIVLQDGKKGVVSIAATDNGWFEVMALRTDGTEIQSDRVASMDEAKREFDKYVKKHTGKPIGKYADLMDAFTRAKEYAFEKTASEQDGGTCNFDSVILFLPRWDVMRVMNAASAAGVNCRPATVWGKKAFMIAAPLVGQANRRTVFVESMRESLKRDGYDTGMWYQMD